MLKQNYFSIVLVASVCAIDAVQNVRMQIAPNIRKCSRGDGACLSSIFTKLIQNSTEFPDFNIPDLRLYQPQQTWKQQTPDYDSLKIARYTAYTTDIFLHGLNTLQVHQMSGLGPQIYAEITIPKLKFASQLLLDMKLVSLLRYPVNGDMDLTATSLRVPLHIRSEVIKRNGKQYLQIKHIDLTIHITGDLKMDINLSRDAPGVVKSIVDEQVQSNWKQIRPLLENDIKQYASDIVYETITPIFEKVPIQDFYL